jgi:hypothetical protein
VHSQPYAALTSRYADRWGRIRFEARVHRPGNQAGTRSAPLHEGQLRFCWPMRAEHVAVALPRFERDTTKHQRGSGLPRGCPVAGRDSDGCWLRESSNGARVCRRGHRSASAAGAETPERFMGLRRGEGTIAFLSFASHKNRDWS